MPNLDGEVSQIWNPDLRPLVEEAWRCYNVGASRASIALTWTAVTTDIISKVVMLADQGRNEAEQFRTDINNARMRAIESDDMRDMLNIERRLLEEAVKLELINSKQREELDRIRVDRNRCVHPSVRDGDTAEGFRLEVAGAHLAVALSVLLTHPPTQGRNAIEDFLRFACEPVFNPFHDYVRSRFFDQVKETTRRHIIEKTARYALETLKTEDDIPSHMSASEMADRMAVILGIFATRDRSAALSALNKSIDHFGGTDDKAKLRVLARLGEQDFFWDSVTHPLAGQLNNLIENSTKKTYQETSMAGVRVATELSPEVFSIIGLVRCQHVRSRLPSLEQSFLTLDRQDRLRVITTQPDLYHLDSIMELITDNSDFRFAEQIAEYALQPLGKEITMRQLEKILEAWAGNRAFRNAHGTPKVALSLFLSTSHLGKGARTLWADALSRIQQGLVNDFQENSAYGNDYSELEEALRTAEAKRA